MMKDKTIELIRYENVRVDTGGRTYNLVNEEWLDRSDSPETVDMNDNLPFMGLNITTTASISKPAQLTLDEAAVKIRNENHSDIPHNKKSSQTDILHEIS